MPKTLQDWLIYLESLHPKTIALGLERVIVVKNRLQLVADFPIIVVGGTNGKGSVCAMTEFILGAAGYRVGCYTSPHLLRYNERVRICGQPVGDEALCASFEQIERIRGDIPLTYFEYATLAAMQSFTEQKVDVAILEVGLGGRLDAVNAFDADCSIVTCVDIDHTDYLGESVEQIAFEKAGIFRRGCAAIFGDVDVPESLRAHALQTGAELRCIGHEFGFRQHAGQWDYHGVETAHSALPYPALRGSFQLDNASCVLAALDALSARLPVSMAAIRRGLVEVRLMGRFQIVPGKPQLVLDVAHNPHAARSLAQNLATLPPSGHNYAVFAMLKDKDMAGVINALESSVDTWLVASIDAPRGASSLELGEVLREAGVSGEVLCFADTAQAIAHACNVAGENDRIIAFGSFYTVAQAMFATGVCV